MLLIKRYREIAETFHYATDIPVTVIDDLGNPVSSLGNETGFCKYFEACTGPRCPCGQTHLCASRQSENIGGAYIFSCPAGLINFTVPILEDGQFKGAVIGGPFLMDYPDDLMVDDIVQKFALDISARRKVLMLLRSLLIVEPFKVRHLSDLLFASLSSAMEGGKAVMHERSRKSVQQARIGEHIQEYKNGSVDSRFIYEKEKELIGRVQNGDIKGARSILNDLIGLIFFSSGGSIERIKARTLELCTLLSRATIESGADSNTTMELNQNLVRELEAIHTLEDLSYWLLAVLEKFTDNAFRFATAKNTFLIHKAMKYMMEHFRTDISLEDVAGAVHLNPSYFSSVFKKEAGISFSSYLNQLRIEESKRLLAQSRSSILNIALDVGFEDQSYFTKVFKTHAKMTPKEYRQQLL